MEEEDHTKTSSYRYPVEINSSNSDLNKSENISNDDEEEDEIKGINNSNKTSKVTHKIHLAHNYIRYIRGPAKTMLNGMIHIADMYTQKIDISNAIIEAVKQGLNKQKLNSNNNSFKPAFTEITSDWIFEGENLDRGFISASIWMHNPQMQRILVKTHGHPLSAVNEWLSYILGKTLCLPVNQVQISIYQNKLVTLHNDIANHNEKTLTFMDLSKQIQKTLLTYPVMESMDLFDHIILNVDRTQKNILITIPNTTDTIDETTIFKIHLIDHSFCFGVGKHHIVGPIACNLHSKHFSVVKFDPIDQARKFEIYLNKLPKTDRTLISKTLNCFANITDEQLSFWMNEISDLISHNQYNRIYQLLSRQRDITKYYLQQWGLHSNINSNQNEINHIQDQ